MPMRCFVSLIAASLLAASSLAAEPVRAAAPGKTASAPSQTGRKAADERPAFALLDMNGDGAISLKEFGPERAEAFRVLDADGDGAISPGEYRQGSGRRDLLADMATAYLLRFDQNENGMLEKKEFRGRSDAFVEADRDQDNILRFPEVLALLGSSKPIQYSPRKFFAVNDLDSDGLIAQAEWRKTGADKNLFLLMDANNDGAISYAEAQYILFRYERRVWPAESPAEIEAKREKAKKEEAAAAKPRKKQ